MIALKPRLLGWLFMIALVQLSCDISYFYNDSSDRNRERDQCLEAGGNWHDIPYAWCEFPPDATTQTAIHREPTAAGLTPTVTMSQCDARDAVSVEFFLDHDETTSIGGRNCSYHLLATNNSSETVAFYVYENRDNREGSIEPRWWLVMLVPGEPHTLSGHGTFWSSDSWGYVYFERAAAVYYNDACGYGGLGIEYSDEAGTAEPFAWDIEEVFCQRPAGF
jgi:hypothetical protein